MARLSGFTGGTLKKFWPTVQKKVMDQHKSFGTFLSGGTAIAAPTIKSTVGKRPLTLTPMLSLSPKSASADATASKISEGKTRKTLAKAKRGKKAKTEVIEEEENSADGSDSLSGFAHGKNVADPG